MKILHLCISPLRSKVRLETGKRASSSIVPKTTKSTSIFGELSVHAREKLVHERQFARAASSARAIALDYLELHMQSNIFIYEMRSFLSLKNFKCLI